mgnify:CR=1 FL=1
MVEWRCPGIWGCGCERTPVYTHQWSQLRQRISTDPTRPQTTQTNSMVCDDHGKKIKANREKNGHQLQLQFHALQLNINIAIIKSTPVHSHNVRQCAATRCASNSKSPPCTPAAHPPLGCPESRWAGSHPRKCAHRAETCCYETWRAEQTTQIHILSMSTYI